MFYIVLTRGGQNHGHTIKAVGQGGDNVCDVTVEEGDILYFFIHGQALSGVIMGQGVLFDTNYMAGLTVPGDDEGQWAYAREHDQNLFIRLNQGGDALPFMTGSDGEIDLLEVKRKTDSMFSVYGGCSLFSTNNFKRQNSELAAIGAIPFGHDPDVFVECHDSLGNELFFWLELRGNNGEGDITHEVK